MLSVVIAISRRPPDNPLRRTDLNPDPIEQFRRWFADAARLASMPEAMTLCTADADARPSGRMVLLKGVSDAGFDFYTDYGSRKGVELAANPRAALVFWWVELDRQIRIEGAVARVNSHESDAYFATRPPGSRLSAIASDQSRPVADREALEARVAEVAGDLEGGEPERPDDWGGYRLAPDAIEFWQGRHDRLHDRFLYERAGETGRWSIQRLCP